MSETATHSSLFVDKDGRRRRRRRRLRFALWAVAIWLAGNALAAWLLLHPRRVAPFLKFKDVAAVETAATVRDETFQTSDGLTLRGISIVPEKPRGVVLLFHGYGGTRLAGMARQVASWGYVAVAADFRAHGESDGSATTIGWDEKLDVAAVAAHARAAWPKLKVAGWGLSMGGAAMVYGADVARTFDAVVLEAVYADIDSAYWRRVDTALPKWLSPLAAPARFLTMRCGGLDADAMRPDLAIKGLVADRTLIVTGEKDPWATPDDLRKLSEGLPGAATYVVPGAQHHDIWQVGGDPYLARVRAFLDARLK